jgi:hypothetical protein
MKCEITVSVCILEGINTSASGFRGYFPQVLNYQDFWSIRSMLKELYCFSEAPLKKEKGKFYPCTGTKAVYRPYGL